MGIEESERGLYLSLAELRRRQQLAVTPVEERVSASLTAFELRVFSQNGEDGVLAEILARIGATGRFFVEFGIESGREGNCVYLADVSGWTGLFMEADPRLYGELATKYRGQDRVRTTCSKVTASNVERLFADAGVPPEPDVLSIDVDGIDYWIWDAISEYRPRVVIIEYNSELDPQRRLVQPLGDDGWDGTVFVGASLGALCALAKEKGYRLVHTELAAVNAFFVREDLATEQFLDEALVPRRAQPNYFLGGFHHPRDRQQRSFIDLDDRSGGAA
jgi:hypothetical protein